MKLSDAPTTEATIAIDAPAERVWELISDINIPAQSSPEFQGAEWTGGASGPVVGASFVGRNQHAAIGSWETTSYVIVTGDGPNGIHVPA